MSKINWAEVWEQYRTLYSRIWKIPYPDPSPKRQRFRRGFERIIERQLRPKKRRKP
jgi:hypothetical protein